MSVLALVYSTLAQFAYAIMCSRARYKRSDGLHRATCPVQILRHLVRLGKNHKVLKTCVSYPADSGKKGEVLKFAS